MLYKLLSNPLYIGKLRRRDLVHDGEHQALVDDDLFNTVQALLAANAVTPRGSRIHNSADHASGHLLTGLLYDDTGDRMSPTHAKAHGRRYRYYVSGRIKASKRTDPSSWRIPAPELDRTVVQFAGRILADRGQRVDWIKASVPVTDIQASLDAAVVLRAKLQGAATTSKMPADQGQLEIQRERARSDRPAPRALTGKTIADLSQTRPSELSSFDESLGIVAEMFTRITLGIEAITFLVNVQGLIGLLNGGSARTPRSFGGDRDEHQVALQLVVTIKRRGNEMRLIIDGDHLTGAPDPSLVTLVAKAHVYSRL